MLGTIFNKAILICAASLTLAACAKTTAPAVRTVTVNRPVVVTEKCVTPDKIPQRPAPLRNEGPPANLEEGLQIALAKISEWTRYGDKANLVLQDCAR